MGPENWEESMASTDKIKLCLDDEYNGTLAVDDEESEASDSEDEKEGGDNIKESNEDESTPSKRFKRYSEKP